MRLPPDEPTLDWQRVKDLFAGALERTPPERDAYLAAQSGGNQALEASVRDLLAALEEAPDFLESQDPVGLAMIRASLATLRGDQRFAAVLLRLDVE